MFFKVAQKVNKYLGYLSGNLCQQNLSKIAKSGYAVVEAVLLRSVVGFVMIRQRERISLSCVKLLEASLYGTIWQSKMMQLRERERERESIKYMITIAVPTYRCTV